MSDTNSRRNLLKTIAAGGGVVITGKSLPQSWTKPVVNSVILPAHAETTDDTDSGGGEVTTTAAPVLSTYYSRTNLTSPEWDSKPGGSDHIRACVMLDGATATVTWQSIYRFGESVVDESDVLLTGTLTNGEGTLTQSANSCAGQEDGTYEATITNVTPTSLTLSIVGNRTVSVVLPDTNACVAFIPDGELCNSGG